MLMLKRAGHRLLSKSSTSTRPEVSLVALTGVDAGISILTLSRPHARNALSVSLLNEFSAAVESVNARAASRGGDVRALIVASDVPGVFCAGADLVERGKMNPSEVAAFVRSIRSAFSSLAALPMPTWAAIEGAAVGGGLEMALACDARIIGASATLGLPEASLAIVPGAGGIARLPRLVGAARAKDLIFSARRLKSEEALSFGLVNGVAAEGGALAAAIAAARLVAANGPIAVAAAKAAINSSDGVPLGAALEAEAEAYAKVLPTADRLEGLASFREKRKPVYHGK